MNMASMPDLIFTVLFFFMIVTHMRTEDTHVKVNTPSGTEITKTVQRHSIANLYIGRNSNGVFSVQFNGDIIDVNSVEAAVAKFRSGLGEGGDEELVVNIKADRETPMSIINNVKSQLRKSGALKIRYSATKAKSEP